MSSLIDILRETEKKETNKNKEEIKNNDRERRKNLGAFKI